MIGRRVLVEHKGGLLPIGRVFLAKSASQVRRRRVRVVDIVAKIRMVSEQLRTLECVLPRSAADVRDSHVKSLRRVVKMGCCLPIVRAGAK
jgi:hypothetical protein